MSAKKSTCGILILFLCLIGINALSQGSYTDYFENLHWRHIGPAVFGGRIPDIEAVPENPAIIYTAGSTGGVFKTTNNGITWEPIFDDAGTTLSIGDIALAPSDPLIVWVGSGEANGEQGAASLGDGVFKSLDGGKTWQNMGLRDTRFIHRVVIHPENPDIVFVASPGHRWGPNAERGLFRTQDGGKTWKKVLYINEDTGVADVVMEANGRVLYASAFQRRRHAWGNLTGGPDSGIYRSFDGGDTWEKLGGGLPEGTLGKIALAIAKSSPNVVYAAIGDKDGGLYRTEDRGTTWTRVNDIRTSYWYGNIYVDPLNENKLWIMGTQLDVSIDGGKTFENDWTAQGIHVDHHVLWINPKNTDHMLLGNDGGFYITYDGARNWRFINNIPIAQFYAINVDNRDPYHVYGGLQDNGTWGMPSRTYCRTGILNEDVLNVGGGDGFVPAIDPRDHTVVYAESQYGGLTRMDLVTRQSSYIKPTPEDEEEQYRFNWNSPILISAHDPDVIYFGGNKVFKTVDKGENWEVISPDLTRNENPAEWEILGLKPSLRAYNTITAIAESPVQQGVIYAATDDQRIHVTLDEGKTWDDLTDKFKFPDVTKFATKLCASLHDAGTAYISFTGHYYDDFKPYIYRTTDFGDSWKSVTGDMPDEAVVKAVIEHPGNPDLLFAGIHNGLMVTVNGGKNWIRAGGLPPVAVDDIKIKNNDLILGTYGRGIIIMDDIAFLEKLSEKALNSDAYLFPVREAEQYYQMRRNNSYGGALFAGENPEYGAMITYYLKDALAGTTEDSSVLLQIIDENDEVVHEIEGPDKQGFNRIAWDLRVELDSDNENQQRGRRGPRMRDVDPGSYTVQLIARGKELSQSLKVVSDKRKR
ncbi:WD40/YVTN/BNR-like repeat-containing protein [candidate division KSB1 bacterium]